MYPLSEMLLYFFRHMSLNHEMLCALFIYIKIIRNQHNHLCYETETQRQPELIFTIIENEKKTVTKSVGVTTASMVFIVFCP